MKRCDRIHELSPTFKLLILISLVAGLALLLLSCGKKEEPAAKEVVRPVKTIQVEAGTSGSGLTLPGKVRAAQRVVLAFKEIGGRLSELPVEGREGEQVEKDALIARIDPRDFEVNVRNARGGLGEAEASLKLAESEYARVQRIRERDVGAVSEADIDRRREAVNQAKARIKSLKATVDAAKLQLSYTYLRAPFSGVIARRYVDNFQEVKPKQPIVSLQDISQIEILVNVPESIMAMPDEAAKGMRVLAQFPTAPNKDFPLSLKEIATDADPATQTYQAVLQMPQPEGINVFPGMTATVSVSFPGKDVVEGRVLIPAIAVVAGPDGKNHVWVVKEEDLTVHKREVDVGRLSGSQNIVIQKGLKGGETIVVAGVLKLKEGMKVRLWEQ